MHHRAPDAPSAVVELLVEALAHRVAPWVRELGMRLLDAGDAGVTLALPLSERLVHAGGALCGQALMAAADTAMALAVLQRVGSYKPMSTVQLQTNFVRALAADSGEARVVACVLRMGRSLVYGEVRIVDAKGQLVAHATTTYMML
mgnify:CR=1 FL=1